MRLVLIFVTVVVVALLGSASGAMADFYRYVDSDGVVHITNVPVSSKYAWIMLEDGASNGADLVSFDSLIYVISQRHGVEPSLVKAIVKAESDFDSMAISRAGAKGLMQLMPETARRMGVKDIYDPEDNVNGGTRYLSKLLNLFGGRVPMAVAAYNAGESAVLKYGAIPPYSETQTYVKRVMRYYDYYSGKGW
jgi:soluble lytic murein transglycosylase